MKPKSNPFRSPALSGAAVVFACFSLLNSGAQAQTFNWTGNADADYATGANWVGGVAPGFDWAPIPTFTSAVVNGTVNVPVPYIAGSIVVDGTATTDITFTGSMLSLGQIGGAADGYIHMAAGGSNLTFNSAIANAGWNGLLGLDVGAGRTLTLNGGIAAKTFDPPFAPPGGIVKDGTGAVVITTAAANFTQIGSLTINAGSVNVTGTGELPSAIAVNQTTSGAVLDISGISASGQTIGSLTGAAGTSVVLGGKNLTVSGSGSTSYAGVISGTGGSFTKTDTGTLTLSDANTYSGVTTLAGGILNVASLSDYGVAGGLGNRAPGVDGGGNVGILFQGGTLQYTGSTAQSTNRGIRISTVGGGATIDASGSNPAATLSFTAASSPDFFENGGDRTLTLTGSNTGANTFAMAIGDAIGTTSFVKSGVGTWVLTGANNYTGTTTVNGGTLNIDGSISSSASISIAAGATLNAAGYDTLPSGNWTIAGILNKTDNSIQDITNPVTLNNGTISGATDNSTWGTYNMLGGTPTITANGPANTINAARLGMSSGVTFTTPNAGDALSVSSILGAASASGGGLTKTGDGTLTMSGTNTYTGDTTVTGGTLSLGQVNSNNESSTVSIAAGAGAKIDLAFGGTDTVDKLYINGVQQPIGDYTAAHASGAFTGGGTLHVTSGPAGFAGWITGTFANGTVSGGQQGAADDPDLDGVNNLMEYSIAGLDPTVPNGAIGTFTGNTLSYTKRQPLAADLTYVIETSPDLQQPWTPQVTQTPSNTDIIISYLLPTGQGKFFGRLRVEKQP